MKVWGRAFALACAVCLLSAATESTVPRLKSTLDAMAQQVIAHNASNRHLLKARMNDLRQEISSLRAWPKTGSPFAEAVPSLIDITT